MNTNLECAESITLTIWGRSTMDDILDTVVQDLSKRARGIECGILVTRTGLNTFTASLSQNVPYGTTQEKIAW
jgi:hypothetical protein